MGDPDPVGPAREIGARATENPDLQVWEKHTELWGQGS